MKRYITEEEKELFFIKAFDYIKMLRENNKVIKKEINVLYDKLEELEREIKILKIDYDEFLLLNIGKGKYYKTVIRPVEIKERICELYGNSYDFYEHSVNEAEKRKYELLIKPLLEDLDQAIKEETEVEKKEKEVTDKYNDKVNEYNSVRKDIKKKNTTLYSNEEEILKTTKNISKVENKFNDNKKINEKLLKLKTE